MKKKVLIFAPFFTPSVKGGGPIVSITNIVENLAARLDFYIVTSDRDLGDEKSFTNIQKDKWTKVGKANVLYINPKKITTSFYSNFLKTYNFDYFYFNSFFDFRFTILPLITIKKSKKIKGEIVIAPRGEFSPGALQIKIAKKKLYIKLFTLLKVHRHVNWHATADSEKKDITNVFGKNIKIKIANNLTENYHGLTYQKDIKKDKNEGKFVFLSRVHPKKNLKLAINLLSNIKGDIRFSIYGPIEDKKYWQECESLIVKLPSNVHVEYGGLINHKDVQNTFKNHHFFLFPTYGENYGHVISEALIGGCPVIISDQTPWRDLESVHAGWDISLENKQKFINTIQKCVNMSQSEYVNASESAFNFGKRMANKPEDIELTYQLFS